MEKSTSKKSEKKTIIVNIFSLELIKYDRQFIQNILQLQSFIQTVNFLNQIEYPMMMNFHHQLTVLNRL
jgi:hypothetical protein